MNIEKYTVKTQEAVKGAIDLAVRKGNQFVTPLHLLGTILDLNDPTNTQFGIALKFIID